MTEFLVFAHKRLIAEEKGIVALLTLGFMTFIGFTSLLVLWGLSYTSGAYTTLYGATQAAAYASVSQVDVAAQSSAQPSFDCGDNFNSSVSGGSAVCTQGRTAQAARDLLSSQVPCSKAPYGLHYCSDGSGNVKLLDDALNPSNGILAYEVAYAPGAAFVADSQHNCDNFDPQGQRICWTNPYAAIAVTSHNYSSGVVVATQATIPFFPGCNLDSYLKAFFPHRGAGLPNICRVTFLVTVPASVGQQEPFPGTNQNPS